MVTGFGTWARGRTRRATWGERTLARERSGRGCRSPLVPARATSDGALGMRFGAIYLGLVLFVRFACRVRPQHPAPVLRVSYNRNKRMSSRVHLEGVALANERAQPGNRLTSLSHDIIKAASQRSQPGTDGAPTGNTGFPIEFPIETCHPQRSEDPGSSITVYEDYDRRGQLAFPNTLKKAPSWPTMAMVLRRHDKPTADVGSSIKTRLLLLAGVLVAARPLRSSCPGDDRRAKRCSPFLLCVHLWMRPRQLG